MPEEAAAAVAAPNAAEIQVPAAEQPPTPAKPQSFHERFNAVADKLGSERVEDNANGSAPEPKSAEKVAEKPAEKKESAAPDKRAQLEALAKELGLVFDGNSVTVAERADFRQARARREQELAAREAKVKELEQSAGSNEQVKKAQAVFAALEAGDPDAFAQAIGRKDFNEFQQDFIKRLADPNYQELRKLQAWREEREKREAEEKTLAEQREHQRQRAEFQAKYLEDLGTKAAASSDPLAKVMADDPMFRNVIFAIQKDNYDPDAGSPITLEQALDRGTKGAKQTFRQELKGLYERLHKAFGGTAPAAPERNGKRPAPRTAVTPSRTTEASGSGAPDPLKDPNGWRRYSMAKLAEASDD